MPVVGGRAPAQTLLVTHRLQSLGRTEATKRVTAVEQHARVLLVDFEPFALPVRAVRPADVGPLIPTEAEPP